MRAVIQRCTRASVRVDGTVVGALGERGGLAILLGVEVGDTRAEASRVAEKLAKLRIFEDTAGKMNLSVADVGGSLLVISQFTLAADPVRGGNRPGFSDAAEPGDGLRLYEHFLLQARKLHGPVEAGRFGADMQVHLVNDGPVTIPLKID